MSRTPPTLSRDSSSGSSGQNVSSSSPTDNKPRSHHAKSRRLTAQLLPLKPIAAKPPTVTKRWQPLVNRVAVQKAVEPRKILVCAVCGRPGCQLVTHRNSASRSRKGKETGTCSNLVLITDEAYKKSYAYYYAQAYVDASLGNGRIDPFHSLPLPPDLDTKENHSLFHYYFSYEIQQGLEIPKPPEFAADNVLSPMLLPAMGDTSVCLSALANAAALFPTNQGLPPDHVRSMEFAGRAMRFLRDQTIAGSPPSDNGIIAQAFLWAVSMQLLDKSGMQGYANSVHALVRARGGLQKLGMQGFVAQFIRWVDVRHSLVAHTASTYMDAPDPPALFQAPARNYGSFWDTEGAVHANILSQNVLEACRIVCRIIELGEDFFASGATTPRYIWMMEKLLHSSAARSGALETYEGTGSFNELVILANELALHLALDNPVKQRNGVLCQSIPLVKAIKKIDKQFAGLLAFPHGESDLLLWSLFLVVMVPHEFEGKDWAFDQVCQVVRNTVAKTGELPSDWTEEIYGKLSQFTWSNLKMRKIFNTTSTAIGKQSLPR